MRGHQTAFQFYTLVLIFFIAASSAYAEEFACPGKYNCSCARERQDEFELSCPDVGEQQIAVQLKPHSKAIFQCQTHTTPDDYNLLTDVHIDAGNLLEFRLCPLPDVPFTDLLQLRNPAKIQTFNFRSYRVFNDTLERIHFKGLTGITSLSLANNGLTALPSDLFEDMPRLQQLLLPNNLVQPPADLFQSVLSLEVLELGKNDLSTLPVDLFRNLKKLQLLNLWKNKLSNLSPEMFKDLTSLTSLDLRHNGLTSLPADIFKYLISLKNLSLNGNNFQTLPSGLFSQNKKLESIQFSDSRHSSLSLPNGLFSNLSNLKTVDLQNSGLKEIPEDIFWGSTGINSISIQNNQLKELPLQLFRDSKDLEKLFLSSNQIHLISDRAFEHCKKLRVLDFSHNKLTNLSVNALFGLELLEDLSMANNFLRHVDINTFQSTPNLKVINLANNKLSFLDNEGYLEGGPRHHDAFGDYSPLRHCLKLEKINLSNNSITDIFADWRLNMLRLSILNLSHNALQSLIFQSVVFIPSQSREIDVRHNKISVIDLRGAESWATQNQNESKDNKRQKWLLEGNPLQCDCYNYHFLRYLEKQVAPEVLSLVEFVPGNLVCAGPAEVINEQVENVPSKAVTCPLASIGDASTCPNPCQCHFRTADLAIIVDCVEKNLTDPPAEIPFSSKSNRTELYLTKNRLRSLPDFNLPGYQSISKLALGHNNITSLNNITALPPNIQIIELDHNNLTIVDFEAMQVFYNLTNLTTIKLDNNPWKCECQLQPLVNFVQARYKQIPNHEDLKCTDGQLLTELTVSGLCAHTSSVVWASLVIALLLGALIGGAFAVYYRYTHEIKAWLFAHNLCLWFVTEEELDKDKLYDAFVSYSHKDEEFVVNELVPGLEGGPTPFKLCLHYRDWVVGEWIPNQITRSVEDSRRTLVVLSPNFLESVWGRMEFRAAHCQALSEGRARVIVVLLGDIGPTENLDPELRAYLNMNTYVKWGDPWFWKKLRYALPHPPKAMKGSMGLVNRTTKHTNGKPTDDKIELICEPNAPAPVTTPPAEGNTIDPLTKNAKNGTVPSPRKVPTPSHESNGKAVAVG